MKALVAVDLEGKYKPALTLWQSIACEKQSYVLAHVDSRYGAIPAPLIQAPLAAGRVAQSMRASAERAVRAARLRTGQTRSPAIVVEGNIASSMMRLAEENRCDLILLGSTRSRTASPWKVGSVTRKLAFAAPQSLLVTKTGTRLKGPLRAVFATDHSDYANKCLDMLVRWHPRGLAEIHVVTAYELPPASDTRLHAETAINADFAEWLGEHARCLAEKAAEKLKAISPAVHVVVERGDPNEVVRKAMKATGSDLLILGAHGHGFFERLLIGSVSLRQLLVEPYPVLLLRLPKA